MASNTNLFQHPLHQEHPLEPLDCSKLRKSKICRLCWWWISADAYACQKCSFYTHRVCAEAPPRIDLHPLHTQHPLTLVPRPQSSEGEACSSCLTSHKFHCTVFRCDECDFNLDLRCTLSTSSDRGGGTFSQWKTPEQIKLPLHPHTLTWFSTRHEFVVRDVGCVICKGSVEGEGYTCLRRWCKFLIHKRCVPDLYYKDGTKANKVYHEHPLEIFRGEDMSSSKCSNCLSDQSSREFIGCASCGVFYCRDCVQVPEIIQYPHHPDHNLVLFIESTGNEERRCDSCSMNVLGMLKYVCASCRFFVDEGCALKVLSYCEQGMSAEIKLSWHQHPLLLCHKTESEERYCSYCEKTSAGPMYACKDKVCKILLHKGCIGTESTIIHPHHPDHPLTLGNENYFQYCGACGEFIHYLNFSCELCAFYLHAKCAARLPTRKHPLHEHELIQLKNIAFWECNRCATDTIASFFRCVPCEFNIHEECMDLPLWVSNSKVHWHPLTLQEIFLEDDTGEYYCEHCENRRDGRLGAYVCGYCKISMPRIYHIECVLPELGKVYEDRIQTSLQRMDKRIKMESGRVRDAEEKLEEYKRRLDDMKRNLDRLIKKKEELIAGIPN